MAIDATARGRLRKTLRRHARAGWTRAVFAQPGDDPSPIVHEGPGSAATESQLAALIETAEHAAAQGRVKHTLVIDDRTRVKIDARHGRGKVQHLDDARATKMMGGKDRTLRPDASAPLLRVIGLMNADGTISAKHAKKYKQVEHFVQLCRPTFDKLRATRSIDAAHPLAILDLACGNAYLTFVIAEALRLEGVPARIHGIDVRPELVARAQGRAEALGWSHVGFAVAAIADTDPRTTPLGRVPDLIVSLHACDTATDDAIAIAIAHGVDAILCAPCCQRELANQLDPARVPVPAIARHGLLARDYAASLTDALRAEILDACGYHVDAVEFVGSEHTPKNLLLRAHRRHPGQPVDRDRFRLAAVIERCKALGIRPTLLHRLTS